MADIVNLKDHRKRRARAQKEADAAARRLLFGRTRSEKTRDEMEKASNIRKLDGARRDRKDD